MNIFSTCKWPFCCVAVLETPPLRQPCENNFSAPFDKGGNFSWAPTPFPHISATELTHTLPWETQAGNWKDGSILLLLKTAPPRGSEHFACFLPHHSAAPAFHCPTCLCILLFAQATFHVIGAQAPPINLLWTHQHITGILLWPISASRLKSTKRHGPHKHRVSQTQHYWLLRPDNSVLSRFRMCILGCAF